LKAQKPVESAMSGTAEGSSSRPHRETFAAELRHFRHEGEPITQSLRIERGENFSWALYLNEVASAQL
jgi:hypothetical protein